MLEAQREDERRADLPFPVGVRALLPDDAVRRRALESAIVEQLGAAGYREVILPVLDFAEPYADVSGGATTKESYRLIDREGELLTLRADFTPMVARAVAPRLDNIGTPLRIFYRGDVVRCESPRLGSSREYFQIGAELVGDDSTAADAEIIRGAVEALGVTGSRLTVSLGDAELARVAQREPDTEIGRGLLDGTLSLEAIGCGATAPIAERLTELVVEIERSGVRVVVTFDRADSGGYYTGARFRIYAEGSASPIAQGGRYDSLYGCFGTNAPAVGFTLNVDALEATR